MRASIRSPRRPAVRFAVLALAAAAALAPRPAGAGADAPIVIPPPADLEAAARAIAAATGAKPGALALDAGEVPLAEGRSFPMPAAMADRLIAGSQAVLRRAGLSLFRHERGFGMGDDDRVALLATADPGAVIRRMGTSAGRPGLGPEKVAAWLRALAADEPCALVEVGPDVLVARFERPPADPLAIARRAAEIAPDVLSGGATSLEALAEEIRRTGTVHLIWD